jgi:uncharacterized protein
LLIRFRARNFRSLKEEQELSLVASSLKDSPDNVTHVEALNTGLLRAAAIYGANASGKTNVIKALQYMAAAVQNSQRLWPPDGPIPREPFLLDPESKNDPSSFAVDLLLGGVRFHYGFSLNDHEVLEEWLNAYPRGKRQTWFRRERGTFTFGKNLTGENRAIENLTRSNSLFLSAAAQNNHEALLPLFKWFTEQLGYVPRERGSLLQETAGLCKDDAFKDWVVKALTAADLGVVGVGIRELDLLSPPVESVSETAAALLREMTGMLQRMGDKLKEAGLRASSLEKSLVFALLHRGATGAPVSFEEYNESDGTVAFLGLLAPAIRGIWLGGTLCVDELDASLHPLLGLEVVRWFNDLKFNSRNSQIIFTTHDTNILDKASLRRDQIWFTEKDAEGGTHLYPLTDFKPRKKENFERGYLQGRYGAIPFIGSTDFLSQAQRSEH